MKKILAILIAFTLLCSMLISCDNAKSMLEKASAALEDSPYSMTVKMNFECDNEELNQIFSMMNLEIPMIVDGENIAMDMSVETMGYTTDINVIVFDKVMYYDMSVMGQSYKMKASMNDEQYKEYMSENNNEIIGNPGEFFDKLTVKNKDGKKYVACGEISDEGLEMLNDMIKDTLESIGGKATVSDVTYDVILSDGKYESMDMTCVYSVTTDDGTFNVTFKLGADFSYDDVAAIKAPADASKYQDADFDDLIG